MADRVNQPHSTCLRVRELLAVEVASLEASSLHCLKLVKFDPQTCTPFSEVANLQIEASCLNEEFLAGNMGASGLALSPTAEKKAVKGSRNGDESLKGSCSVVQIVFLVGQVDKH